MDTTGFSAGAWGPRAASAPESEHEAAVRSSCRRKELEPKFMIAAPRTAGSSCVFHSRHPPSGGFPSTLNL